MERINVAIILVTYNGMQWLNTCLQSCKNYSVIIVDNASTDETVTFIQNNYPNVTLLKQTKNLGFGQANNLGIRYALDQGAAHVFLLNQDAYLIGNVLENLMTFQKANPTYGILSPIHITGDKQRLDTNFSKYMLKEKTGKFYSDFVLGNPLAKVYEVPFVNAAAWLLSRECLETVGGFDPLFFHYGEDDNYCQRIIYHGFKIGVLPKVFVIHDRGNRVQLQPEVFSKQYYKEIEKSYKVRFANILLDNTIKLKRDKLSRTILKLRLKIKFQRASLHARELSLLKQLQPAIEKSRQINKTKGTHYLYKKNGH
ncbi:glycosyltransferase family 2 protein [Lacinutrix himadriensis]|uniref:glycosyltransferase family 2 protein n=1 Tax=Lacinutrix himadriensis TaxID=641549 RepID=UPI0006E2606E|nr:glycosyltransferase family 2 protein [Lacinutrix himadriensis]